MNDRGLKLQLSVLSKNVHALDPKAVAEIQQVLEKAVRVVRAAEAVAGAQGMFRQASAIGHLRKTLDLDTANL